jgi:hypothetical protein
MSDTADFSRARLDEMVHCNHPLVVLSKRLPCGAIEKAVAPHVARKARPGEKIAAPGLFLTASDSDSDRSKFDRGVQTLVIKIRDSQGW